jgi:hypothetical protein
MFCYAPEILAINLFHQNLVRAGSAFLVNNQKIGAGDQAFYIHFLLASGRFTNGFAVRRNEFEALNARNRCGKSITFIGIHKKTVFENLRAE